jgi:hypothetical protein
LRRLGLTVLGRTLRALARLLRRFARRLARSGLLRALLPRRGPAAGLASTTTRATASLATLRAGRERRDAQGGDDDG